MHLVCPHCAAINAVPEARLGEHPKCGKCRTALLPSAPPALSAATFRAYISKNTLPVLMDFWAPWCGPCKMMAPAFAQVSQTLQGRCLLAKLNTEEEGEIAGQFQIRSIPTMILFQSGKERARSSGAMSAPDILRWLKSQGVS